MHIEKLKRIIINQKEEVEENYKKENIIDRDIDISNIQRQLVYPNVVVITGVRRCGKSTLSVMAMEGKKFGFLNFDDNALAGFTINDFDTLLQAYYELFGNKLEYFVFDEIQNIDSWELFITKLRRTKKIIITGSNAHLLSGELSTHLTGRHYDFTLYPFSFREYLKYHKININKNDLYSTAKIARLNKHLDDYIIKGGFPEVYKFGIEMAANIYGDILTKDVLLRYNVRHKKALKELSNYLISLFGQEYSYRKLAKIFEIKNVHTVKNYVSYLSESYLISSLNRFSFKLKKQHIAPKKSYGVDMGFITELAFQSSPNKGSKIENLVFLELLRNKHYQRKKDEIFYWQDAYHREVDYVIKRGSKINEIIQVSYSLENYDTKTREIKALLKASQALKCDNLTIITRNDEGEEKAEKKTIKIIPLYKFLLQ